jgi:hypothetical protein
MAIKAEQIEQCAQIVYEAGRALIMSRGMSALNEELPPPWLVASQARKQAAREAVMEHWKADIELPAEVRFEVKLVSVIVWAFRQEVALREEVAV